MNKEIDKIIKNSGKIILSTHEKPDGDGLGSAIAFYYYLKNINKDVRIVQPSPFPEQYKVIDPEGVVETYSDKDDLFNEVDLLILFDIGHYTRAKKISEIAVKNNISIINIDHHKNENLDIFKAFIIDIESPATGQIVWKYLKDKGLDDKWDIKILNALYAAVMTDTGSFRYNNTNVESHVMASELIAYGVKPYDIYVPIYEQRSLSQLKLLSYVISNLKFNLEGQVCSALITLEALKKLNATFEDIDGFTEFLRSIKNVEVSFLITEQLDGSYRINFRSKGKYIINDIANKFDGGGHKFAAGCKIKNLNIVEIEQKIVNLLELKIGK